VFIIQVQPMYLQNVPRWTRPSSRAVETQAILFASFATSLFATLLAVLGKQWLNRYVSVDMRKSVTERSQNKPRKLDRTSSWHISSAVVLPTLMLHITQLLLSCAIFDYLWEVNVIVAPLLLGVTLLGVLSHIIIAEETPLRICSYQTTRARTLLRLKHMPEFLHFVLVGCIKRSAGRHLFSMMWDEPKDLRDATPSFIRQSYGMLTPIYAFLLPFYFLMDAFRLLFGMIWPLVASTRMVYLWLWLEAEREMTVLDLHCVSRTLRTSWDEPARISALRYLATMTLVHFDPVLFASCLDVLVSSIDVTNSRVTTTQGSEELAALSSLCCLHTLSHLTFADPMVEDVRQRYTRTFPPEANFNGLPFSHTLGAIHSVFYQTCKPRVVLPTRVDKLTLITWQSLGAKRTRWEGYKPPVDEHVVVARAFARITLFEYPRRGHKKVPRWLLRFAYHSLSQDPLPPTSAVADCLSIIAVDLGCYVSATMDLDERCAHV
jgi:hypothetical protein